MTVCVCVTGGHDQGGDCTGHEGKVQRWTEGMVAYI